MAWAWPVCCRAPGWAPARIDGAGCLRAARPAGPAWRRRRGVLQRSPAAPAPGPDRTPWLKHPRRASVFAAVCARRRPGRCGGDPVQPGDPACGGWRDFAGITDLLNADEESGFDRLGRADRHLGRAAGCGVVLRTHRRQGCGQDRGRRRQFLSASGGRRVLIPSNSGLISRLHTGILAGLTRA